MKIARYPNKFGGTGHIPEFSEVAYVVEGDECVFSGLTPPHARTPTNRASKQIMETIAKQEGKEVGQLRFYDLQTAYGYGIHHYAPGQFKYSRIILNTKGETELIDCPIPHQIKTIFHSLVYPILE